LASAFVLLLLADEVRENKQISTSLGKRSSYKTKRGIKIRRHGFVEQLSGNNLAKFQPN